MIRTKALVDNSYWPFVLMGQYLLYMLCCLLFKSYILQSKDYMIEVEFYDSNSPNQVSYIELLSRYETWLIIAVDNWSRKLYLLP